VLDTEQDLISGQNQVLVTSGTFAPAGDSAIVSDNFPTVILRGLIFLRKIESMFNRKYWAALLVGSLCFALQL
jgi:hypothetical protein